MFDLVNIYCGLLGGRWDKTSKMKAQAGNYTLPRRLCLCAVRDCLLRINDARMTFRQPVAQSRRIYLRIGRVQKSSI